MNTAILAIGLALLIAIGAAAYVHAAQRKQRKADADANRIAAAVTEYFARSGAQVSAIPLQVASSSWCNPSRSSDFAIHTSSKPLS